MHPLIQTLEKQICKQEKLIANLRADLVNFNAILSEENLAELLKSHLHMLHRGMTEVTVTNYFDLSLPTITITLEPMLTPQENVTKRFKQITKAKRGLDIVKKRFEAAKQKLTELQKQLEAALLLPEQEELPNDAAPKPIKKQFRAQRRNYSEFRSSDGFVILVGKNDAGNEELSHHIAHGNDLWLHVKNYPGSHVVVRLQKQILSQECLLDAATLAAHFSKAKDEAAIDVTYTFAKHIKRAPGSKTGSVLIHEEKTLHLKKDEARLMRLLKPKT